MTAWVRFEHNHQIRIGQIKDGYIASCAPEVRNPFDNPPTNGEQLTVDEVKILMPCLPTKMIALWNNYAALAKKNNLVHPNTPLYLFKPTNSFAGDGAQIVKPKHYDGDVYYEGELGIVIGKLSKDLSNSSDAEDAIFGYTCINDVTAFGLLKEYSGFDQWTRAKGFDGFGIFGPAIATQVNWQTLEIITRIDGQEVQHYSANDMIFNPLEIVVALSRNMTLNPGDIICCGTSLGLGPMLASCTVEVEIPSVGRLRNPYRIEPD